MSKASSGLWIPGLLLTLMEEGRINAKEMVLISLIHNFTKKKKGQCFASNSFFAQKLHVGISQIQSILSNLKKMGLVKQAGFDGRNRWLELCFNPELEKLKLKKTHGQNT